MTATVPSTDLPGRCPQCGFHPTAQGHRSTYDGNPTGCDDSGPLGEQLRDEGMARAESAHPDQSARIDAVIRAYAATRRPFSANDVRPHLRGIRGGVVGARFNAAGRRGLIRKTGQMVRSTDAATHAHPVCEWVGAA